MYQLLGVMQEFVEFRDAVRGQVHHDDFSEPVELVRHTGDVVVREVQDVDVVMSVLDGELVEFADVAADGAVKAIPGGAADAGVGAAAGLRREYQRQEARRHTEIHVRTCTAGIKEMRAFK